MPRHEFTNSPLPIYLTYMGFLLKAFAIFWAIWIIWYITGGPLRNDGTTLFVQYGPNGQIIPVGTSTQK